MRIPDRLARAALLPALAALLSLLSLAACASRLAGQPGPARASLGTVRDSASRQPLPGAVVLLLDSLGRTVGRGLTDERGQYRVPTTADARRFRVLRLGFRPQERELPIGAGEAAADVFLAALPSLLERVRVTAAPSCPRRADRATAFALLEQVRAGLLATVVARAQNRAAMTRILFERRLDGGSDRIVSQSVRLSVAVGADRPFGAARSGLAFVRDGFLEDGTNTFFAPDAETLVDDAFTSGYCFHLAAPDRARPHQIGLGFAAAEPRDGRIDIEGALWVDTLARTLRDLEFRYVGLDRQVSALGPGGRLSLRAMANGITLVDGWSLRLVSGRTSRLQVTEIGGALARATWPDGTTWAAPLGTLRLHAVTRQGRPAPGTVVHLDDTDYEAVADSAGVLEIAELLPGPYRASVVDPRLAALGVPLATALRFVAARDSTSVARLEIETADDVVARRCLADRSTTATADTTGTAWLLGRVVAPDGRPVADARWTIRDRYGAVLVERGRVGGDGLLHWCQLTLGTTVVVEASQGTRRATATTYLGDHLTTVRLVLDR